MFPVSYDYVLMLMLARGCARLALSAQLLSLSLSDRSLLGSALLAIPIIYLLWFAGPRSWDNGAGLVPPLRPVPTHPRSELGLTALCRTLGEFSSCK